MLIKFFYTLQTVASGQATTVHPFDSIHFFITYNEHERFCDSRQIAQLYPLKAFSRYQGSTQIWGIWLDTGWFGAGKSEKNNSRQEKRRGGFTEKQIRKTSI